MFFHSAEATSVHLPDSVEVNAVELLDSVEGLLAVQPPDMEDTDPDEPEGEDVKRDEQLGILQILDKLDEVADILING